MNQKFKIHAAGSKPGSRSGAANSRASSSRRDLSEIGNKPLRNLPPADLESLSVETVYLSKKEYIYRPDDLMHFLYFPETVVVSEYQILEDGCTVELAMTGREGVIGFSSIYGFNRSTSWAQVLIPGRAMRVGAENFKRHFQSSEVFQKMLFQFVNSYISQMSQRVICNNHHKLEKRLCYWLLTLSRHSGSLNLPVTQEQIASILGIHRPNVTLVIGLLRERGIIRCSRGKIIILDKPNLERMACECSSAGKIV